MIARANLLPLKFVDKEDFAGSHKGMRFMLHKEIVGDEKRLRAYVWSEPFCFDVTPDDEKFSELFEFSDEGVDAALDWMNEKYVTVNKKTT